MVTLLAFCVTDCARADSQPSSAAPNAKSQDPLDRKTPQSAMISFLEACKAGHHMRGMRYVNLNQLTPEQRRKEGPELARDLATILERDAQFDVAALSREPEGSKPKGLPPDRDRLVSLNADGKVFELQLERVNLRQADVFVWLVAPEGVSQIPKLVQLTSESPVERLLPPPLVRIKLVDTALWRWIALVLLIAAEIGRAHV